MVDSMCNCGNDIESTISFLLQCTNFTTQRQTLANEIHLIGVNLLTQTQTLIIKTLLFWKKRLTLLWNNQNLKLIFILKSDNSFPIIFFSFLFLFLYLTFCDRGLLIVIFLLLLLILLFFILLSSFYLNLVQLSVSSGSCYMFFSVNDTHGEKLVLYWIQYKNSLK